MALNFPLEMFMQAAEAKNRNQQQQNQDIIGIGQGVGAMGGAVGNIIQQQRQKKLMDELLFQMRTNGLPQQGPPMAPQQSGTSQVPPGQPMSAGGGNVGVDVNMSQAQPASGMGAPAQDNTKLIQSLMTSLNPEAGMKAQFDRMDPYKQSLANQANAEAEFKRRPPIPKIPLEYIDTGRTTLDGKAIYMNKATGEETIGKTAGTPKPAMGSAMSNERHDQFSITQLPSNQGASTAGGAAYQVKVGARQGMNLIARPGSPQRTAAAAADLVRAITRVAPTDEGLHNANFSDNVVSQWSRLKQRLTADPSLVDNPKIRKEMYDIFKEMDESATPFIQNQLDDLSAAGYDIPEQTRKRQLGLTLPKIPFQESMGQSGLGTGGMPQVGGNFNGQKIVNVEPM